MAQHLAFWLVLVATSATGLLAGASLDQSIKQLPARRQIGIAAYSAYSQASDLSSGVIFYGILGIGSALLTVIAGIVVHLSDLPFAVRLPADLAAVLSVLHSLATTRAAPKIFAQRRYQGDSAACRDCSTALHGGKPCA